MKLSFFFYSRLALGRQLKSIVKLCQSTPLLAPERVLLTSREQRADLTIEEVVTSAHASGSDSCEIQTKRGEISMAWVYGQRRHVPRLWGALRVEERDLANLIPLLDELAVVSGTTYGVCDLDAVRQESVREAPDTYGSAERVEALHALYWYNCFGAEYRKALAIAEPEKGILVGLREIQGGGQRLLLAPGPRAARDLARTADVSAAWPFFRKYDPAAGFKRPVQIDYSEVWNLPPRTLSASPPHDVVGPTDSFLASVVIHADRFRDWLRSRGLTEPRSEEDFLTLFQAHEAIIRDELLVPAIAAYGEMVRSRVGGVWKVGMLLNRGEPVVVRAGRPWTARRVIREVLEALEPVDI